VEPTNPTSRLSPRRANAWKHAFVYFWLVIAALAALVNDSLSPAGRAGSLALLAALGGWYGYWYWYAARAAGRNADRRIYLMGAIAVWVLLMVIDPGFVIVGVSVAASRSFDDLRWALAPLVLCAAAWLWQAAAAGELEWFEVAIALLFLASGATAAGYTRALAHQNAERQRLIDQLEATRAELAAVERRAGVLTERQRLAREIHDTLTQGFASIAMLLEAARAAGTSPGAADRHLDAALRSARDNLTESRRLVWALRPDVLADAGLPEAAGQLVERFREDAGVDAELVVTGTARPLDPETETALLRVAQESLANVRKHARAHRVTITLSYMNDVTVLDVQDDGVGFPATPADRVDMSGGLGVPAMRERAAELGGHLTIETAPGEGTTVAVEVPARAREPRAVAQGTTP
jgi:signal transduction histidine kinase